MYCSAQNTSKRLSRNKDPALSTVTVQTQKQLPLQQVTPSSDGSQEEGREGRKEEEEDGSSEDV